MFDRQLRGAADRPLRALAGVAARGGVSAGGVTLLGLLLGLGAAVAIAAGHRYTALALWLANRLADGLDGAVARRTGATDRGGFIDLVADFVVYAAFVVGVAYDRPPARLAAVVLLATYYVSAVSFLTWSALAERRALARSDNRSLRFAGGLAEGGETIVLYSLICVWPDATTALLWIFAAAVGFTAAQRAVNGWRSLSADVNPHR